MSGARNCIVAVQLATFASFFAPIAVSAAPASAIVQQQVRVQLDSVPVAELVTILYRDVLRVPYVVAPEVAADRRLVSVRLDAPASQARARILTYLHAMGLVVTSAGGVDQVTTLAGAGAGRLAGDGVPYGSPLSPGVAGAASLTPVAVPAKPVEPDAYGVYIPRFRDPAFLADIMRGLFPAVKFGSRQQAQTSAGALDLVNVADVLVFAGPPADVKKVEQLSAVLDSRQAELDIRATVYEVQTGHTNQSALSVALNIIGGKVLGGFLGATPVADTFARLKTKNVDAVVSALSSDSRFKVVTSPSVRTRSGAQAVLTSGSQVPILGSISYQGASSTPVQSVEYRDSGVILRVRPVVHREVIDLDVSQELSSFAKTDTGVNTSPTLNKRSLVNSLSLSSGDVVVLGGLTEDRDTVARSGLFKGFIGSRSKEHQRTEVLLVLQVTSSTGGDAAARSVSEDGKEPSGGGLRGQPS